MLPESFIRGRSLLFSTFVTTLWLPEPNIPSPTTGSWSRPLGAGSTTIYNRLPELLELLYFADCSSLFSTADRFDFFKNKKRKGGKQRVNTLTLTLRIKILPRHAVKLSTHRVLFGLIT